MTHRILTNMLAIIIDKKLLFSAYRIQFKVGSGSGWVDRKRKFPRSNL